MNIHRITQFTFFLLNVAFFFCACQQADETTCLTKVVDMKGEQGQIWKLRYDEKGRLVEYGDTPICYGEGKITIGGMEWKHKQEQQDEVVYYLTGGEVRKSVARCMLNTSEGQVPALKKTYYHWMKDTLQVISNYYVEDDFCPLWSVEANYVYDAQNRLTEILSTYFDEEGEESGACHCYYGYEANIHYISNLNLLAYVVDREGLDLFFYLLLNLNGKKPMNALPDQIRHCVNRGKATYTADGLYRLIGYTPTKVEIISLNDELKARLEFEHATDERL